MEPVPQIAAGQVAQAAGAAGEAGPLGSAVGEQEPQVEGPQEAPAGLVAKQSAENLWAPDRAGVRQVRWAGPAAGPAETHRARSWAPHVPGDRSSRKCPPAARSALLSAAVQPHAGDS
jgi:hypothetical protein